MARVVESNQTELGQLAIADIQINPKSRDDIPKILRGLQYIYTTPEIRDEVFSILEEKITNALLNAYQKITVGDPLDPNNLMGPLIDQGAVSQFLEAIQAIKQKKGQIAEMTLERVSRNPIVEMLFITAL